MESTPLPSHYSLRVKSFTLGQDIFKFRAFQRVSFQRNFATFKAKGIVLPAQFPGLCDKIEKAIGCITDLSAVAVRTAIIYKDIFLAGKCAALDVIDTAPFARQLFAFNENLFKFYALQFKSFQGDYPALKAKRFVFPGKSPSLSGGVERANSFTTYVNVVAIGTAVGYRTANAAIRRERALSGRHGIPLIKRF